MEKYELKFDPKTIEHLGVKMYSTLPPALSELISNAYDADASNVVVEFHEQNGNPIGITVIDDGIGMSSLDIQEKFLVIGRNRRTHEGDKPSQKFNRLPTGKKGLGKLALFGLAKDIVVDTTNTSFRNRFKLNWDSLLKAEGTYNPTVELENVTTKRKDGTIIELSNLKRKTAFNLESIADSLSRIFIVDSKFKITLKDSKGNEIQVSHKRRYSNIEEQFKWTHTDLVDSDDPYFGKIEFSLITTKTPIPPSSGLRGIAIFSRGKLVNLPEYFSDSTSSHFYQYLTGWVKADFIDLLDEDVISTNRQSINWDNLEMTSFRNHLSQLILKIGQDWRKKRSDKKDKDLEKETGINKENWFNTLPEDVRSPVEAIVKKMGGSEDVAESYAPVIKALYELIPEYPLLHWRHLHEKIKDGVFDYYKNQQYGHAADQGAKIYSQILRDISKKQIDGSDLGKLFHHQKERSSITKKPIIQISKLSTQSEENIQEGQQYLTMGLMKGFRNPINHAPMAKVVPSVISELDCLNILSLVSYLTARLDNAIINPEQQSKPI